LREVVEKMLETGAFPRKGTWRNLWNPLTEYFKRQLEGSGKGATLSVAALIGKSPFWGFGRISEGGLRGQKSPHGVPLTGNSER